MNVKTDQVIRAIGMVCFVSAYAARLHYVGNGPISLLNYTLAPFSLLAIVLVLLALPETIDMLPFGPSRSEVPDEKK